MDQDTQTLIVAHAARTLAGWATCRQVARRWRALADRAHVWDAAWLVQQTARRGACALVMRAIPRCVWSGIPNAFLAHPELVRVMISHVDSDMRMHAICRAAMHGHHDSVQMLLQNTRADPSTCNRALIRAADLGRFETVCVLLRDPRVDPSACDNAAVRHAAMHGHTQVVRVLMLHPRMRLDSFCAHKN